MGHWNENLLGAWNLCTSGIFTFSLSMTSLSFCTHMLKLYVSLNVLPNCCWLSFNSAVCGSKHTKLNHCFYIRGFFRCFIMSQLVSPIVPHCSFNLVLWFVDCSPMWSPTVLFIPYTLPSSLCGTSAAVQWDMFAVTCVSLSTLFSQIKWPTSGLVQER